MAQSESVLQKVHVFQSNEQYETNKESVGADDIALVPADGDSLVGEDYSVYRARGIAFFSEEPASVPNGCIACIYE